MKDVAVYALSCAWACLVLVVFARHPWLPLALTPPFVALAYWFLTVRVKRIK
jgi:hypothetical protein